MLTRITVPVPSASLSAEAFLKPVRLSIFHILIA